MDTAEAPTGTSRVTNPPARISIAIRIVTTRAPSTPAPAGKLSRTFQLPHALGHPLFSHSIDKVGAESLPLKILTD